ncbi:bacillithiol biosynthesis cysteine-adding enzyme BshC [Sphingobacterium bambusae]|uniref:Putative cysteine ligase BshC n=1 Tax=Sphingobacterium bambusae TaxID=662858 RepID=A0ABW6BII9_9SPHI|nr:bacillithiol biosynthesis cysteine-adding enzyme BshC [Sphingobacterium bambusae]WPL51057.1 bacillithiol biosynthesis cysteine-adding enzyme BshC [Sphingobacterium bambusae]
MKATYIDYSDTGSFSKTLLAYLANDERLQPFYGERPDLEGFRAQIERKQGFQHRSLLVSQLEEQYGPTLADSPRVAEHIALLKEPNTFTVTTGHQLNIFTGPLYFIFKIVSAIRLAKDLKKAFPEYNFVPVYWMATEDHDFAEINNTRVFGKKISWDVPAVSGTGRMSTSTIADTVKQYCNTFGISPNADRLKAIVEQAYLQNRSLADATRDMVNAFFKQEGLVIIDADRKALKEPFIPYILQDVLEEKSVKAIDNSSKRLTELGFQTQVHARDINFFYLTDEFRERIVRTEDGRFEVLHQQLYFTAQEMKAEIEQYPERFSPNVVMRPLYEEIILPNLAYIGGGAEIVYWLQLRANFNQYDVPFPILIPRNSAMITDDSVTGKIYRLDLTFKSIFKSTDALKNEYVRRHTKHRLNLRDEWMELNAIFGKIKLRTHKIDPSLGASTEAVKARLKKAINSLEKKLLKADKHNYDDALLQIERVKDKLFPNGGLQERSENFAALYIKHGEELIQELEKHFNPLDFKFTIVY